MRQHGGGGPPWRELSDSAVKWALYEDEDSTAHFNGVKI